MATWEPYPATQPDGKGAAQAAPQFEAPPWQAGPEVVEPEPTSQELERFEPRPGGPVNPDLDGDGHLDAAERAYAANLANRRRWRKTIVTYRATHGWETRTEESWTSGAINPDDSRMVAEKRRMRGRLIRLFPAVALLWFLAFFAQGSWVPSALAATCVVVIIGVFAGWWSRKGG
ncbi:MAG TPA: hypothetical protein PLA44_13470 [Propionibacteriaceae bacterium]|nr:hypothetical protein [Propionibacteriaceae bacterium]